jgi:hypothetical protein
MKGGNYSIFHLRYLVIKNIAYYPLQVAQNSGPVMNAVLDCLQARGIETQENSMTSDAAVIWSALWHGRMANNEMVYRHYRAQGKPVIIIEIGALYRGQTWKISVNNITSTGYYGHQENLDWDRPRKLGISLAVQTRHRPYIIIAAQHRRSLQLEGVDMEAWISKQIKEIRTVTDMPIHVRPHPRCRLKLDLLPKDVEYEIPHRLTNTYDSFDMHFDCHAVVNYNSGPGIQSAISGTRPIVDKTSLAYPVSVNIPDIEKLYNVDRDQWLTEVCHTEYTLEEITQGSWLKRIVSAL